MGQRRVGIPEDPASTAGIVIDADTKTIDLVAPAGININGAPLAGGTSHTHADHTQLAVGEAILDRYIGAHDSCPAQSSGTMTLAYFVAQKTETITQVKMATTATAAAPTPTLCRIGIYRMTGEDGTLVASIPNDTTLFATANTLWVRTLSAPFSKVAGVRYAVANIVVSAGAMPTFMGYSATNNSVAELAVLPRVCGSIVSLTDLPATFPSSNVGGTTRCPQAVLLP